MQTLLIRYHLTTLWAPNPEPEPEPAPRTTASACIVAASDVSEQPAPEREERST